jgi:hypothetical protein
VASGDAAARSAGRLHVRRCLETAIAEKLSSIAGCPSPDRHEARIALPDRDAGGGNDACPDRELDVVDDLFDSAAHSGEPEYLLFTTPFGMLTVFDRARSFVRNIVLYRHCLPRTLQ